MAYLKQVVIEYNLDSPESWKRVVQTHLFVKGDIPFENSSAYEGHLRCVYSDATFIKDVLEGPLDNHSSHQALIEYWSHMINIGDKYAIRAGDVEYFHRMGGSITKPHWLQVRGMGYYLGNYSEDTGMIDAKLKPDMTELQFKQLWKELQNRRRTLKLKKPKQKGPQNGQLLYAIFLRRKNGMTFPNIFALYEANELTLDTQNEQIFQDTKALENYYHLYYPALKRYP